MVVQKYPFTLHGNEISGTNTIELPDNAYILEASCTQSKEIGSGNFWAMVDPNQPKVKRKFRIFATGEHVPSELRLQHVKTMFQSAFVWHLFEELQ